MKISKKVIVSSLASVMGLSLVGAISGTVAWYQYSTRSTAAFIGTSIKMSENMQISVDNGTTWKNDVRSSDLTGNYINDTDSNVTPITYGAALTATTASLTASNFKAHPVYQYFGYEKWAAAKASDYVQFTIKIRIQDVDGSAADGRALLKSQSVWLQDLTIQKDGSDEDLSKAVRVHIANAAESKGFFLAKEANTVKLGGYLDLNGNHVVDRAAGYEWDTRAMSAYGNDSLTHVNGVFGTYKATDDGKGALSEGTPVGITAADTGILTLTVTIWLEGWHIDESDANLNEDLFEPAAIAAGDEITTSNYERDAGSEAAPTQCAAGVAVAGKEYFTKSANKAAMWDDTKLIGAKFDVGFTFACSTLTTDR